MIFRLSPDFIAFPDPALAETDGLLAVGGDLSPERLILAYSSGIFPWYNEDEPILWYAPHERCVLFPEKVKVTKSMQHILRKHVFSITTNMAFEEVIKSCADTPRKGQNGTWIGKDMQEAYLKLHEKGIAKSVEVWFDQKLVGGLYGIDRGAVFCGESMFSLMSNASKAALIWLCKNGSYKLIDCQIPNPHLISLGAEMMARDAYLAFLI
jgi:leucyl/phenylalanyl-tRNA---protein transferase